MFTSMELDEKLFNRAFSLSRARTKKALVEEALRIYVRLHEQAEVRSLRGKLLWEGDLDRLRGERLADPR
jgi:Arc/MetJ family transcription regulator